MQKKSAAAIDEEQFLISQIKRAVAWTAHIRLGPADKITERFDGNDRADDAFAKCEELNALSRFGRRAMVFAITDRGDTIPVSRELLALARADALGDQFRKAGIAGSECRFSPL